MNERLNEVCGIVAEVIDMDAGDLNAASSRDTLEAWDSIAHLNIITSLEASYDIEIDLDHALELSSIEGIVDYLARHVGP